MRQGCILTIFAVFFVYAGSAMATSMAWSSKADDNDRWGDFRSSDSKRWVYNGDNTNGVDKRLNWFSPKNWDKSKWAHNGTDNGKWGKHFTHHWGKWEWKHKGHGKCKSWDCHDKTKPVPEPATMLLLGSGIAGLIGTRLRKKK